MSSYPTNHLHSSIIVNRCDPSLGFELRAQLSITDTQSKLLLFRRFRGGEVRSEEVLESCCDLGLADGCDIFKGLLSGLECVLSNKFSCF